MTAPTQRRQRGPVVKSLVNARIARGLTQKQLAVILGVSPDTIAAWENGRRTPTLPNAEAWADALDCQLAVLAKEAS